MSDFETESQEDRIKWLRERGVQIELPEERKNAAVNFSSAKVQRTIKIVKIPADERKEYEEINMPILEDLNASGDLLLKLLSIYFKGSSNQFDLNALNAVASKQFANNSDFAVSEETVKKMSEVGSVEAFSLSHFHADSSVQDWDKKVSLYLDEAGQLKNLPPNARAASLAALCGFDNVPLVGDMFVGRVIRQSGDRLLNVDFNLCEMASDAAWLQGLKSKNYQHGLSTNKVAMADTGPDFQEIDHADKGYKWIESDESIEVSLYKHSSTITAQEVGKDEGDKKTNKLSAKDVKVEFKSRALKVSIKDKNGKLVPIFNIALAGPIIVDESTWCMGSIKKGADQLGSIDITLVKREGKPWGKLEEG